MSADWSRYEDD